MKVVGYVRVSTEEQGRSGLGLKAQRNAIREECARRGWELVGIEEDVASDRSRKRRPGLARAVAACAAGTAEGLVAAKLDRLSRSLLDFAALLDDARRGGWTVVALDQGFDLSTPNGRAMAGMLAVFAQWERELIGERTSAALAAKRADGWEHPNPRVGAQDVSGRLTIRDAVGDSSVARLVPSDTSIWR